MPSPRKLIGLVAVVAALSNVAGAQPLTPKRQFIEQYQGNFGSIKLTGCGFHNDSLFDPVVLLVTWTSNKPCESYRESRRANELTQATAAWA